MTSERVIRYPSTAGRLMTTENDWEQWFGDAGDRAILSGRHGLSFRKYYADELEKQREEIKSGYRASRSAKEDRQHEASEDRKIVEKRTQHVAELGRQSFRLRGVVQPLPRTFEKALIRNSQKLVALEKRMQRDESEDEEEEDLGSEDEDWDTSKWSKVEIEGAVDMLIAEIRTSSQLKRRRVATNMLTNLLRKHKTAVEHVDLLMPTLAEKGLFVTHTGSKRSADSVRLGHFLAVVAGFIPEKMSRFACAKKSTLLLSRKFHLAARLLQAKWRAYWFDARKAKTTDIEARIRRRAMNIVVIADLVKQWHRFFRERTGELSLEECLSQLKLLTVLCSGKNSAFCQKDRRLVVEQGGLYPIQELCMNPAQDIRAAGLRLLLELASQPEIRLDLLQSGVHVTLGILLQSELVEDRSTALEVVDILSCCICYRPTTVLEEAWSKMHIPEKPKTPTPYGMLFKESKMTTYMRSLDPVLQVVDSTSLFVDRRRDGGLLRWLKILIKSEDGLVRLGSSMCLLKLASGCCNPFIVCHGEKMTLQERQEADFNEKLRRELHINNSAFPIPFKPMTPISVSPGTTITYDDRRRWRIKHLVHSMLYNVADLGVPGLSIITLQLFAQLCACPMSRAALLEVELPELVLMNLCSPGVTASRPTSVNTIGGNNDKVKQPKFGEHATFEQLRLRGLVILTLMACNASQPVPLSPEAEVDGRMEYRKGRSLQQPYLAVLGLDIFAEEADLARCLQTTLLSMVSQTPDSYARASVTNLCFHYRGWTPLFDILLQHVDQFDLHASSTMLRPQKKVPNGKYKKEVLDVEQVELETVEQLCVMALVLGKFCVLSPAVVPNLGTAKIISSLCHILRWACNPPNITPPPIVDEDVDVCRDQPDILLPDSVVRLVQASADACCVILCETARCSELRLARQTVSTILTTNGSIKFVASLISRGSKTGITSRSDEIALESAISAARLVGALIPWMGFQMEAITDVISQTSSDSVVNDRKELDFQRRKLKSREEKMKLRASENARKAAEQGLDGTVQDVKSMFPTSEETQLVKTIVAGIGKRLVNSLRRTDSEKLRETLCYCLARLGSTVNTAGKLLEFGIGSTIAELLPARKSHSTTGQFDCTQPTEAYLQSLVDLPPTFFTLCAAVARTLDGKYRMLSCGVLVCAIDILTLLQVSDANCVLQGEAALLLARLCNTNHPVYGAANNEMLRGGTRKRSCCLSPLLHLCRAEGVFPARVRLHALLALAQLSQDQMLTVDVLAGSDGIDIMVKTLRELEIESADMSREGETFDSARQERYGQVQALIRQALRVVHAVARYMVGEYHDTLLSAGLEPILQRLSRKKDRASSNTAGEDANVLIPINELAREVLATLRLSLAYGAAEGRRITTAPVELERPLTSGIGLESAAFKRDKIDYAGDPFQFKGQNDLYFSPNSGTIVRSDPLLPSTAKPRMESDKKMRAGSPSKWRRQRKKKQEKRAQTSVMAKHEPLESEDSVARFSTAKPSASKFRQKVSMPECNTEISFSDSVPVPSKPSQLLWTRPAGKPNVSKMVMEKMSQEFLLSTRPSKQ